MPYYVTVEKDDKRYYLQIFKGGRVKLYEYDPDSKKRVYLGTYTRDEIEKLGIDITLAIYAEVSTRLKKLSELLEGEHSNYVKKILVAIDKLQSRLESIKKFLESIKELEKKLAQSGCETYANELVRLRMSLTRELGGDVSLYLAMLEDIKSLL